jgi:hypothetical protein
VGEEAVSAGLAMLRGISISVSHYRNASIVNVRKSKKTLPRRRVILDEAPSDTR